MTKRQQIVSALETRLKTIKPAGGYATRAGDNVHLWRVVDLEHDKLPALVLRDTADPMDKQGLTHTGRHQLSIEIEGIIGDSLEAKAEERGRDMLADVLKAIGTDDTFGGLCFQAAIAASDFAVVADGKRRCGFSLTLVLSYQTARWSL